DNLALHAACQDPQASVIAVFISTPVQWAAHGMAHRQAAFLRHNLQHLQAALAARGIALNYHQCDYFQASNTWLVDFFQQQQVDSLFYSQQYEQNERLRHAELAVQLSEPAITC
ncbi:deoxyribodipyrimidine photo-lyase, partial [Yersinia pestis]|uniref:deoxyribodipyrimidine photo-lyase n=1 Tax=Yersinia pestis TaxID=632 RepID=UPI001C440843